MGFTSEFVPLPLEELRKQAAVMKADGYRFIQTHAVNNDNGIDLYYSFMKDGEVTNFRVEDVTPEQEVPSITDLFMAAFVFENEARELFGVNMTEIAIDFHGAMYAPAVDAPMTFISPEQKAAKEKARKAAAAKAAKEAAASKADATAGSSADSDAGQTGRRVFVMTPELQARLDAKMPSLSPEKREKVEAALKARAAEAEEAVKGGAPKAEPEKGQKAVARDKAPESVKPEATKPDASSVTRDAELEELLGNMDPQKAAKVKAAIEGRADDAARPASEGAKEPLAALFADDQVERLLNMMGDAKAAKVLAALNDEEGK